MARRSEPYGSLMRHGQLNEEAVHSLFTNFDADGDGVISSKELAGLLLGLALTSENAADSETDKAYWMKVGPSMTSGLLWETMPSVFSQCLPFQEPKSSSQQKGARPTEQWWAVALWSAVHQAVLLSSS